MKEGTSSPLFVYENFMEKQDRIRELAQNCLVDQSLFLVEVVVSQKPGAKRVLVILDGDNGVTIDTCAEVSRKLSAALDESSLIEDRYTLEVASPGLDHPLKLKRQYFKNRGRKMKVTLKDKKIVQGKLMEVMEESVTLEEEVKEGKKVITKSRSIAFSDIEKALVMVSFK